MLITDKDVGRKVRLRNGAIGHIVDWETEEIKGDSGIYGPIINFSNGDLYYCTNGQINTGNADFEIIAFADEPQSDLEAIIQRMVDEAVAKAIKGMKVSVSCE